MESLGSRSLRSRTEAWIALVLCAAVLVAGLLEQLVRARPAYAEHFAPGWLPLAAAGLAAAGIILLLDGRSRSPRLGRALSWGGLLLMLWAASGLPLDLLRVTSLIVPGLMPPGVDWPGLATRALALAALVVLAHLALAHSAAPASDRKVRSSPPVSWYGYAAFALAMPYPVLKTLWALGGSFGLKWPGADGLAGSFALWLPAIPWLLAAALSLLLASPPRWMPRRLLLAAGWSATVVVAMVGPVACWSLLSGLLAGDADFGGGMAGWVFALVYGSWFLWAIAAGAATRSYQLRSAALPMSSAT
jgi:hypothetical protein